MTGTRRIAQVVSGIALAATIAPSLLYLAGSIELETMKRAMLAATVVWFVATPLWMGRPAEAGQPSP